MSHTPSHVADHDAAYVAGYVTGWADGWRHSRGVSAPRPVGSALRIDVRGTREHTRWLLPDPSEAALADLLARPHADGACVKFPGDPEVWLPRFPAGWEADQPVWFMTADLRQRPVPVLPDGYRLDRPHTDVVAVTDVYAADGELAARGRCGLGEEYAVPDQIVTEPAHRRQGLGSVVMTELLNEAVRRGRRRAVLGASADGRMLYGRLGWTEESPMVGVYHRPGSTS